MRSSHRVLLCGLLTTIALCLWSSHSIINILYDSPYELDPSNCSAFSLDRGPIHHLYSEGITHHHDEPPSPSLGRLLFPLVAGSHPPWVRRNQIMLRRIFRCMEGGECIENGDKIVILVSYHFRLALQGHIGGEDIWATSTMTALENLGYSTIVVQNIQELALYHQMFSQHVVAAFAEDSEINQCVEDIWCIESRTNPSGIPIWKLFAFFFWAESGHPLGNKWTLSPEPYGQMRPEVEANTYLGYSVESCRDRKFIPHDSRPQQAYILAKTLSYLSPDAGPAWTPEIFDAAIRKTSIYYALGADEDQDGEHEQPGLPVNYINYGKMPRHLFHHQLAHSRVLIGVKNPALSPTPYDALCLGVPFINPIVDWDSGNPDNRDAWVSQHGILKYMDPPYVYNVFANDTDGFVNAVQSAIDRPIDSYYPERMTMSEIERRLAGILETDWKAEATAVFAKRENADTVS